MWWLIIWEGGEDAEVRGRRIDWGRGGSQVRKGMEEEEEECLLTWAVLERGRQGKHVRLGETREGRRGGNVRTLYTLALPPVEGSRALTWAEV
jgi:hypothetical protein